MLVRLRVAVCLDVGIRHTAAPIETISVGWRQAAEGGSTIHSFAQHRGTCQGVRSAAGSPDDGESTDLQEVGDGRDVTGSVRDGAARLRVRATVAGPVVADEASA